MKPPRYRASTALVTMAMAGANLPDMPTKKSVVITRMIGSGNAGRLVSASAPKIESTVIEASTCSLSWRSANRPMKGIVKNVQAPPQK